jgi:hypothetical protein
VILPIGFHMMNGFRGDNMGQAIYNTRAQAKHDAFKGEFLNKLPNGKWYHTLYRVNDKSIEVIK